MVDWAAMRVHRESRSATIAGVFLLVLIGPVLIAIRAAAAADPAREFTSPAPAAPEYGHGLTRGEAEQGWISLFDGGSTFGWTGGHVQTAGQDTALAGGAATTSEFGDYELRIDTPTGGDLV